MDVRGGSAEHLALGWWSPAEALFAGLCPQGSEVPHPTVSAKDMLFQLSFDGLATIPLLGPSCRHSVEFCKMAAIPPLLPSPQPPALPLPISQPRAS